MADAVNVRCTTVPDEAFEQDLAEEQKRSTTPCLAA
jgi:hypothetical protein